MKPGVECEYCGRLAVTRLLSLGRCNYCGLFQPIASIWAMPKPTGYAYYAPPGAFWVR